MADNSTKTVTIKFRGDLAEVKQSIKEIGAEFEKLGATVTKQIEQITKDGAVKGSIAVAGTGRSSIEGIKAAVFNQNMASLARSGGAPGGIFANPTITSAIPDIAQKQYDEGLKAARATAQAQAAIAVNGANDLRAIDLKKKADLVAIETALQEKLTEIQRKFSENRFGIRAAENRRIKALNEAAMQSETVIANTASQIGAIKAKQLAEEKKARDAANAALDASNSKHKSFLRTVVEFSAAYGIVNRTLGAVSEGLKNIPKAGIALEGTKATLGAMFGTEDANKTLSYLDQLAEKAGRPIASLREAYVRFAPAAVLAGESQQNVNSIFSNFTETAAVLHMDGDRIANMFLALEQMYSKGVVQSEEIKKQLGNALPAAVEMGAKAMKMSPAAFMEAMKQNKVIATQFVKQLSELYLKTFSGEGGKALAYAENALQSQLGRLNTAYTHFSEKVYEKTSSTMADIVKGTTNILNFAKENFAGIQQGLGFAGTGLGAAVILKEITAISEGYKKMKLVAAETGGKSVLTQMAEKFPLIASGLRLVLNPLTLTVVGITALTGALAGLSLGYDKAEGFTIKFKNQQVVLTDFIKVAWQEIAVKGAAWALDFVSGILETIGNKMPLFKELSDAIREAILSFTKEPATEVNNWLDTIISNSLGTFGGLVKGFKTFGKQSSIGFSTGFSQGMNETRSQVEDALLGGKELDSKINAMFDGRTGLNGKVQDMFDKAAKLREERMEKERMALAELEIKKNNELLNGGVKNPPGGAGGAGGGSGISKAMNNALRDIKRNHQILIEENDNSLKELETQNTNNLISFKDYYDKRKALELKGIDEKRKAAEESLAIATKYSDEGAMEKAKDQLEELNAARKNSELGIKADELKSMEKWRDLLDDIATKYKGIMGEEDSAAKSKITKQYRQELARIAAEKANGTEQSRKEAAIAEQQYNIYIDTAVAQEGIAKLKERENIVQTQYQNKLQRIDILKRSSAMSEMESLMKITEANRVYIDQQERLLSLEERKVNAMPASLEKDKLQNELDTAKNALQEIKDSSNALVEHFKTTVSTAFQDAFVGIVNGTQTAKEAFHNFSIAILNDMAKMVASEISSSFMKMVGMAFGGSGGASNEMSNSIWGMIGGMFMEKGGVFDSGNIVPFARGGVVRKPTLFRHSGGVGLMGERGAEGILPLARTSSGELGVKTSGGGDGSSVVYNISVTVESKKNESSDETGRRVAEAMVRSIAKQEIGKAARLGGPLNKTMRMAQ